MNEEDRRHRIWRWIGREFGAPPPPPDGPNDLVALLESKPTETVETAAARLVSGGIDAFVAKCGPTGQVIVPWPTDILRSILNPNRTTRMRANLYVRRGQLAQAESLVPPDPVADGPDGGQVP